MTPIVWTYLSYLIISIALTIWVARTLFKNGRIFLVDSFLGNEPLADSINRLLVRLRNLPRKLIPDASDMGALLEIKKERDMPIHALRGARISLLVLTLAAAFLRGPVPGMDARRFLDLLRQGFSFEFALWSGTTRDLCAQWRKRNGRPSA